MKKFVGVLAASALAAAAWAAPAQAAEVRIGYSIAKTGLFAPAAPSQINAYNLWAEQVNARGGLDLGGKEKRKVKLIQYERPVEPATRQDLREADQPGQGGPAALALGHAAIHFAIASVLERTSSRCRRTARRALRNMKPQHLVHDPSGGGQAGDRDGRAAPNGRSSP